jgi:hypothetical protein
MCSNIPVTMVTGIFFWPSLLRAGSVGGFGIVLRNEIRTYEIGRDNGSHKHASLTSLCQRLVQDQECRQSRLIA